MENNISVDIKFYNKNNASISIGSKDKIQIKEKLALLLFSSFALRQMHNLRRNGFPLAQVLKVIKSPIDSYFYYYSLLISMPLKELVIYVPLISGLGVDVKELIPHMTALSIYRIESGFNDEKIAVVLEEFLSLVPKIVTEKEVKSKKRFTGNLHLQNNKAFFNLDLHGFGLFGQGANWYAPISVVLFIRYLENIYGSDYKFGDRLAKVANLCGLAYLNNEITITNQEDLSFWIVDQAYKESDVISNTSGISYYQMMTLVHKLIDSHSGITPNVNEKSELLSELLFEEMCSISEESFGKNYLNEENKLKAKEKLQRFSTLLQLCSAIGVEWGKGNIELKSATSLIEIIKEYFIKDLSNIFVYMMTKEEMHPDEVEMLLKDNLIIDDMKLMVDKMANDMLNLGKKYSSMIKIIKDSDSPQQSKFLMYLLELQNSLKKK